MLIVFKIIAFEVKPIISANYDKNECIRAAVNLLKRVLRFPMALRDIPNNLICLRLI